MKPSDFVAQLAGAGIQTLTDAELHTLARLVREEQEHRQRDRARKEDIERRRAAIAAGKGDPGPRRP